MVRSVRVEWPDLKTSIRIALADEDSPTFCDELWKNLPFETIVAAGLSMGEMLRIPLPFSMTPGQDQKLVPIATQPPGTLVTLGLNSLMLTYGEVHEPYSLSLLGQVPAECLHDLSNAAIKLRDAYFFNKRPHVAVVKRNNESATQEQKETLSQSEQLTGSASGCLTDIITAETRRIFVTCPDEIKRFHYGLMLHSEAGKSAMNQYFGHLVHTYCGYYIMNADITAILNLASSGSMSLRDLKKIFDAVLLPRSIFLGDYAGQKIQAKYTKLVSDSLDQEQSLGESINSLRAYLALIGRLYWWFNWYFPWGIGPAMVHTISRSDLHEMLRLAKPYAPAIEGV